MLTSKGKRIMSQMKSEHGDKKGENMFHKMKHDGKITDVENSMMKHSEKAKETLSLGYRKK